jgi:hypothetical protein
VRYSKILGFSGIENHRQDTDLGTLRICEGAVMGAVGSVRSAPMWENVYTLNIPKDKKQLMVMRDTENNKFAFVTDEGNVTNLKLFNGENKTPAKFGKITTLYSAGEFTGSGEIFVNDVGSRKVFIGNGTSQKKVQDTAKVNPLGFSDLEVDSDSFYKQQQKEFPNCSMFVVGMRKCIYGAGNPEEPLTVYVSEPMRTDNQDVEGIYSQEMSKVDILATNATRITALSTYQNYVVVHTDAGVVLLYSVETKQSSAGFRVEQTSAATNSGAINPKCCAGSAIVQPYYLGVDGEVYKDSSARMGPDNKPTFSDVEQVTAKAKGLWNKSVADDYSGSFSAYETYSGVYNFYMPATDKVVEGGNQYHGFYWFDQQNALTGPVLYPKMTAVTSIGDSSKLLGVSEGNDLMLCDLSQLKEKRKIVGPEEDPWAGDTEPNHTTVSVDVKNGIFNYGGRHYPSPMSESFVGNLDLDEVKHFPDAYLSVLETSFEDYQSSHITKQFHEVVANFQGGSFGHVWLYIESDDGKVRGGYKGSLKNKNRIKSFLNVRGNAARIRIYIVSHTNYEWVLKDLAVGFLVTRLVT